MLVRGGVPPLNSMVMEDVFEEVMFELRLEWWEQANYLKYWGRTFQTEGMAGTKALEWKRVFECVYRMYEKLARLQKRTVQKSS